MPVTCPGCGAGFPTPIKLRQHQAEACGPVARTLAHFDRRAAPYSEARDQMLALAAAGVPQALRTRALLARPSQTLVDRLADGPPGREVIELGCGPGHDAAALAAAGLKVLAVDGSAEMCRRARQRTARAAVEVRQADLTAPMEPELRAGQFEAALANTTLCHIPWDCHPGLFGRVRAALRPGGLWVVAEPLYTERECAAAGEGGSRKHREHQEYRSWPEWRAALADWFELDGPMEQFDMNGVQFWLSCWRSPEPTQQPELRYPGATEPKPITCPSPAEMAELLSRDNGRPCVLSDAQRYADGTGWRASGLWSWEWLAEQCGSDVISVVNREGRPTEPPVDQHSLSLRAFIEYVRRSSDGRTDIERISVSSEEEGHVEALERMHGAAPFYCRMWVPWHSHPEMLEHFSSDGLPCIRETRVDGATERVAEMSGSASAIRNKLFIGPAGTVTRPHRDTFHMHAWLTQLRGDKHFLAWPPEVGAEEIGEMTWDNETGFAWANEFDPEDPEHRAAAIKRAGGATSCVSVLLRQGETLVLPAGWWHWAKAATPSITLMRNFCDGSNCQTTARLVDRFEHFRVGQAWRANVKDAVDAATASAQGNPQYFSTEEAFSAASPGEVEPQLALKQVRTLVRACGAISDRMRQGLTEEQLGVQAGQVLTWQFVGCYLLLCHLLWARKTQPDNAPAGSSVSEDEASDFRMFTHAVKENMMIDRFASEALLARLRPDAVPKMMSRFMHAVSLFKH